MIEPSSAEPEGLQRNQFSLRMLLSLMLAIGGGVGFAMGMIPLGSSDGSLFFMPTAVFGDASIIFAGAAVSSYPILLLIVAYKLICCRPRPISVWIFVVVLLLAIIQLVLARPWLPEMMVRIATSLLVVLSVGIVFEVLAKKMESHYLTAAITFALALGYWLFTQFIVVVVSHV